MRTVLLMIVLAGGCGGGNDSDALGIGAECTTTDECNVDDGQSCLTDFKGGYCGRQDCTGDVDCPDDSRCVAHTDGINYCFRVCVDKSECNANRSVDNEANCSSSITFVDQPSTGKACVPPS
jgi:hypothetical protein